MYLVILIAVGIDFIIGDPRWMPNPVKLYGKIIELLETFYRAGKKNLRVASYLFPLILVGLTIGFCMMLRWLPPRYYTIVSIYLLYTTIAARDLSDHAMLVARSETLKESRHAVSRIVGRDTDQLTLEECHAATVETVAENTIDGVLAPLFYMMIGSFMGAAVEFALIYKAISTLDSMIGYRNEKYEVLGRVSARLDDILNFIPARFGSFLILLAGPLVGGKLLRGFKIYFRDRKKHLSPNAGHPEAATAGLHGIQLGGAHYYNGVLVEKPTIGDDINTVSKYDIARAKNVMFITEFTLLFIYIFIAQLVAIYSIIPK